MLVCSCFGFTVDMDAATDGVPAVLLRFSNVPVGFVLAWNSPLHAAFHSHWQRVVDTETGAELPFVGPRARFTGRPSVDAYVPLPDEVAVSFKRDYELVRGRSYRLSFRGSFLDFVPVKDANRTAADFVPLAPTAVSAPIVWRYNPRVGEPNVIVPTAAPSSVKGLRFKQCDSEQVTASKAGWGEAVAQIAAGQTHLQTGGPGSALYVTWFGSGKQYESRVSNVILSTHRWITDYDNATVDCKGADCEVTRKATVVCVSDVFQGRRVCVRVPQRQERDCVPVRRVLELGAGGAGQHVCARAGALSVRWQHG